MSLIAATLLVFVAYFVSKNYVQVMLIQGESMKPTYHSMQLVLLDKHSEKYVANDVVAFYCNGLSAVLVKRVVAVPGDTVQIKNNILYVNDQRSCYADSYFSYAGIVEEKITLSEFQYFVIGDNIEKSKDSRYEEVGIIYEEYIIGKVL